MIGKSIYIWDRSAIFDGDVNRIAQSVKAGGFQSAILHHVNTAGWHTSSRTALVEAMRAVGVEPIGGAAVYGGDPVLEGRQAAQICNDYGLRAFVFDAEATFDAQPKSDTNAVKLLQAFRAVTSAKSVWCWWAMYQSPHSGGAWHPKKVLWAAMAKDYGNADAGMPMAYWNWGDDARNAELYLDATWKQWRDITNKPILPAGRAYAGDGGTVRPESMHAFERRARSLGIEGITWWSMQHAVKIPGVWPVLGEMKGFGGKNASPAPIETPQSIIFAEPVITHETVSHQDTVSPQQTAGITRYRVITPVGMKIRLLPTTESERVGSFPFLSTFDVHELRRMVDHVWGRTDKGWVALSWSIKLSSTGSV